VSRVGSNPADFRRRQKHKFGPVFTEKIVYGGLLSEIKLGVAAKQQVAAT
jgi:hypothetical protein